MPGDFLDKCRLTLECSGSHSFENNFRMNLKFTTPLNESSGFFFCPEFLLEIFYQKRSGTTNVDNCILFISKDKISIPQSLSHANKHCFEQCVHSSRTLAYTYHTSLPASARFNSAFYSGLCSTMQNSIARVLRRIQLRRNRSPTG